MADKKIEKDEGGTPATNYNGQVASQETEVRDAKQDEKPDPSTVAQVEEIRPFGANEQ